MAKVLGKPGRFVEDQSVKRSRQYFLGLYFVTAVVSGLCGFYFGVARALGRATWVALIFAAIILGFLFLFKRLADRHLDTIERERISFRKGAVGEALISYILQGLPNDYVVINDLTTPFGNIDSVVVGPTGVYAIDAKNWKGVVTPDGNDGLLLNGKPTTKNEVKNLVRTVMGCREQVMTLCKSNRLDCDLFIRAVLAFPSARVEAPFGSVKNADCVTDERLIDYITDKYNAGKLNKEQIDAISRAFLALARMDKQFDTSDDHLGVSAPSA
jgi:hypothetical protein